MKKGNLVRYVLDRNQFILTLLLEDGAEVEVRVTSDVATILGDDTLHAMYVGANDEGRPIRRITRSLDPASGHF